MNLPVGFLSQVISAINTQQLTTSSMWEITLCIFTTSKVPYYLQCSTSFNELNYLSIVGKGVVGNGVSNMMCTHFSSYCCLFMCTTSYCIML